MLGSIILLLVQLRFFFVLGLTVRVIHLLMVNDKMLDDFAEDTFISFSRTPDDNFLPVHSVYDQDIPGMRSHPNSDL